MCLLDLLQGKRHGGMLLECHIFCLEFLLGGANVEMRGDDQVKKFFIDNTAWVLIPFGGILLP